MESKELESGTSTKRNLGFYFENYNKPVVDGGPNNHVVYYCNGSEIRLETIIEKNAPVVEVVVLYGSDKGKQAVEEYLEGNKYISKKDITCYKTVTKCADDAFLKKAYRIYKSNKNSIKENNFPVIREYNQPKRNVFDEECLEANNVASIFIKKQEHRYK